MEELGGLLILTREQAGEAEVLVREGLERDVAERLGDLVGPAGERERERERLGRLRLPPGILAQQNGYPAQAPRIPESLG